MNVDGLRLERKKRKDGKTQFYLVKDVRVGSKKAKVTKYLGIKEPSKEELIKTVASSKYEMEKKAMEKKVELSVPTFLTEPFDHKNGVILITALERFRFLYASLYDLLTVDEIKRYEERMEHEYIGGTTAIEGNTLTLRETHLLLTEGIVPDKPLREINEVQNFKMVKKLRDSHKGPITLELIKKFHSSVMCNIDLHTAGEFRRVDDLVIVGREGALCPSVLIEEELRKAIDDYYSSLEKRIYPFFAAVRFHHQFECIHPFTDGNGRVGRELFNLLLMANRFPRLLFLGKDGRKYLEGLALGDEGKEAEMVLNFIDLMTTQRGDIVEDRVKRLMQNVERDR